MSEELKNLETGKKIKLISPKTKGKISIEEAICIRRSVRGFKDRPLTLEQISQLVWAAQGTTHSQDGYHAVPSAGELIL